MKDRELRNDTGVKDLTGRAIRTKNQTERDFLKVATGKGWQVMRKGWPDFLCIGKDGETLIAVEVKRLGVQRPTRQQRTMLGLLARHGIKSYLWRPDTGFTEVIPTDNYGSALGGKGGPLPGERSEPEQSDPSALGVPSVPVRALCVLRKGGRRGAHDGDL